MKQETITIQVEYEISYKNEKGRDDAISKAVELCNDTVGCGLNGLYRAKRMEAKLSEQGRNQTV